MSFIGNFVKVVLALAMMLAVLAVGVFIFTSARFHFDFSAPASGDSGSTSVTTGNGQAVIFTIQPGESVATIADNLKKEGLIDSTTLFRFRLKLKNADDKLKAGRFQLRPGADLDTVISTLTTAPADIGARFTVIEGMRIGEIAEKLAQSGLVDADKFKQIAGTPEGAAAGEEATTLPHTAYRPTM